MNFLCAIWVRTEVFLYFLGCFSPYGVFCVRLVALEKQICGLFHPSMRCGRQWNWAHSLLG